MASCDTDFAGICIARKRGDTAPDKITVLDPEAVTPGTPLDVTGFGFKMTVNTEQAPDPGPPIGTELVSIIGTLVDAPNGVVEFPQSAMAALPAVAPIFASPKGNINPPASSIPE